MCEMDISSRCIVNDISDEEVHEIENELPEKDVPPTVVPPRFPDLDTVCGIYNLTDADDDQRL